MAVPAPSPREAGRGLGRGAVDDAERLRDHVDHGLRFSKNEVRRKAKHADPVAAQELGAALIVGLSLRGEVLAAIELDRQMHARTIEINDVRPARMLAPELEAGEALRSEPRPQGRLCVGAVGAKLAAAGEGRVHGAVFGAASGRLPLSLTLSPLRGARGPERWSHGISVR